MNEQSREDIVARWERSQESVADRPMNLLVETVVRDIRALDRIASRAERQAQEALTGNAFRDVVIVAAEQLLDAQAAFERAEWSGDASDRREAAERQRVAIKAYRTAKGALANPTGFPMRPMILCLCGSTRFAATFNDVATAETLAGRIVLRPEVVTYDATRDPQLVNRAEKLALDDLHLRKIEISDRVMVINVDGYVGESTRREIEHALRLGKPIDWLEPDKVPPTVLSEAV